MIKIVTPEDLQKIQDTEIYPYISELLFRILKECTSSPEPSIPDEVGAIFFLEQESDWELYPEFGLSAPIRESRFEWIEPIENGFCNGYIVINNDCTINIIGKEEFFKPFKEAFL